MRRWLADLRERFGGVDAALLWPTYPMPWNPNPNPNHNRTVRPAFFQHAVLTLALALALTLALALALALALTREAAEPCGCLLTVGILAVH